MPIIVDLYECYDYWDSLLWDAGPVGTRGLVASTRVQIVKVSSMRRAQATEELEFDQQ